MVVHMDQQRPYIELAEERLANVLLRLVLGSTENTGMQHEGRRAGLAETVCTGVLEGNPGQRVDMGAWKENHSSEVM